MKTVQARTCQIQRLGKALEPAGFSELCKPSCKVGMSLQVTVTAQVLKVRHG